MTRRPYVPAEARAALAAAIPAYGNAKVDQPQREVECPKCKAQPGRPCTAPTTRPLSGTHGSRLEAWTAQQGGQP